MPAAPPFPQQALTWLVGDAAKVLVIGAVPSILRVLPGELTVVDTSLVALARCQGYGATLVAASAHALPFEAEQFDACLFVQNLHTVQPQRAFSHIARALRPGGRIATVYTTRDDTVPWVKRLAGLIQTGDPTAMSGNYGADSIKAIKDSHYFPCVEEQTFRTWHPMSRAGLLRMVENRPAINALKEAQRSKLLHDVATLYDSMSRPPEPLLLPYQAHCTRAVVCQDELSIPISYDDGLKIF